MESNSGMLLWAVCQSESSFFQITVLFTPITSLISEGVKPSRGFRLAPGEMITTTGVGAVPCMLNGLKPVIIMTPTTQMIRIKPSKTRVFFLRFLRLGNNQTSNPLSTCSVLSFLPLRPNMKVMPIAVEHCPQRPNNMTNKRESNSYVKLSDLWLE